MFFLVYRQILMIFQVFQKSAKDVGIVGVRYKPTDGRKLNHLQSFPR